MSSVREFDPQAYPAACAALLAGDRLCPLGPGRPASEHRAALEALDDRALFGQPVADREMADACRAGLWLLHNFLDESHGISQGIATSSGSYWHGILHRREPDYANAKYWFRRVGEHPVYGPLARGAAELAGSGPQSAPAFLRRPTWDPLAFVDLVQAVSAGRDDREDLCRRIARLEWELLFQYCYRQTLGGGPPVEPQ